MNDDAGVVDGTVSAGSGVLVPGVDDGTFPLLSVTVLTDELRISPFAMRNIIPASPAPTSTIINTTIQVFILFIIYYLGGKTEVQSFHLYLYLINRAILPDP